jgi:uncharacterized membrane protein
MTTLSDRATASAPGAGATTSGNRGWWALGLLGGVAGMGTAGWQTVERIAYAQDPAVAVACDLNAVISCSSVFTHWQSSALGIPNSIIALPVFAMLASAALAGLTGSRLANAYLATMLGLSVFMTAFVTWYLVQSAFVMGVLCLLCAGCGVAILATSIALTRVAAAQQALGSGRLGRSVDTMTRSGSDLMLWLGLGAVLTVMLVLTLLLL